MKLLFYIVFLFLTFGVTVARETLERLGMNENTFLLGLLGLILTGMLVYRNVFLVILVVFAAVAINLPGDPVARYHLDRDILLGMLIAIALLPVCYRWVSSSR